MRKHVKLLSVMMAVFFIIFNLNDSVPLVVSAEEGFMGPPSLDEWIVYLSDSGDPITPGAFNWLFEMDKAVTINKNNIESTNNRIQEIEDKLSNSSDGSTTAELKDSVALLIGVTNSLWTFVENIFVGEGFKGNTGQMDIYSVSINIDSFGSDVNPVYMVFKGFGYALVLLCFSIQMVDNVTKFESITTKGFITLTGRLVISKYLIDNAGFIVLKIVGICRELVASLWKKSLGSIDLSDVLQVETIQKILKIHKSSLPVIGELIDFIVTLVYCLPIILIAVATMIVAVILLIKLLLWSVDLAILVSIAPPFIACWSSESTKQISRNYIITFVQASVQLVYMAVVFFIFKQWLNTSGSEVSKVDDYVAIMLPNLVILIAMAFMMVKPPKFLSNLIR